MTRLVILGLAVGALSFTITRSSMPLVVRVRMALMSKGKFWQGLLHCPYCFSHWVSAALVIAGQIKFGVIQPIWLDFAVAWLALVGAGMIPIFMVMAVVNAISQD